MTTIPLSLPALAPALIAALIGWRVYKRVRRLIGRQPVRTGRLVATTIAFPVIVALVGLASLAHPPAVAALVCGLAVGVALGWWGLRLTRFEVVDGVRSYIPNARIGVAISLLFVGRLVYRFGVTHFTTGQFDAGTFQSFGRSPLTLAIFGVVAAYYTTYAVGILRWSRTAGRDLPPPEPVIDHR